MSAAIQTRLAQRLLSLIDLTSLNDSDDEATVRALAALASTEVGQVAAVCIWPRFIGVATAALRGSGIAVAAVTNFPAGDADPGAAAAETAAAVSAGANEIDVVFPWRALLGGDAVAGLALVQACREACGPKVVLKVILETGQLRTEAHIRRAAEIAVEGGADFLKTSTGKSQPGATPAAAGVMLEVIESAAGRSRRIGFKASGGVRTIADAAIYLGLYESRFGAGSATATRFRIGASALLTEVLGKLRAGG